MALLFIPESNLDLLNKLICNLNERQPLTTDQAKQLDKNVSHQAFDVMIQDDVSWGVAMGMPDIYQKPESEFFAYLRSINDDLFEQLQLFSYFVGIWFSRGSTVPPHYAGRIATILRKAKLFELEHDFLAVYFKHFWTIRGSSTSQKLGERAKKIGIEIPSIPSNSAWYSAEEIEWAKELSIDNLSVDIDARKNANESICFKFYCLQCGGKVLDVDDETNNESAVRCKKCKVFFGMWGGINEWLSRIAKKYAKLNS